MSDEGEEYGEIINAQSENHISEQPEEVFEEPWQMQLLHELLSLKSVEDYTISELQHLVSTHSGLRKVLAYFYEAYAATFQGIHDQQLAWATSQGLTPITVPYSREFQLSMPTVVEELAFCVDTKIRALHQSNRFPGYDFEKHFGDLTIVPTPPIVPDPESEPEEYRQYWFRTGKAKYNRQERYQERWEAVLTGTHMHDLTDWLQPMRAIQQRSISSAEDAAEQSRRRLLQAPGGGQLLPRTPIRGTPPMLGGTFTSMSSPGGMGNLSYGGGSTIPQNSQFSLQNTTINSGNSGGGSIGRDTRVHRPPFMSSFSGRFCEYHDYTFSSKYALSNLPMDPREF